MVKANLTNAVIACDDGPCWRNELMRKSVNLNVPHSPKSMFIRTWTEYLMTDHQSTENSLVNDAYDLAAGTKIRVYAPRCQIYRLLFEIFIIQFVPTLFWMDLHIIANLS